MKSVTNFVSRGIKTVAKSKVFVPPSKPIGPNDLEKLQRFMENSGKLMVLTGAGLSTESGIPDYRSEGVGLYARTGRRPVQYQDFVKIPKARQIYWARNFIGWPNFSSYQPNISHMTLAEWESKDKIHWLVTQNVDKLHKKAGSKKITELHGCTHTIMCISCDMQMPRGELQDIFKKLNPHFHAESLEIAPDGDVLLTEEQVKGFVVPSCHNCGGIIKPDVVFFGDNVKRDIVDFVFSQVDTCDSMLIAGSSLEVYSGYRFVKRANEQGKPIAMVNIGKTRGDHLVTLKVDAQCGHVLPNLKVF